MIHSVKKNRNIIENFKNLSSFCSSLELATGAGFWLGGNNSSLYATIGKSTTCHLYLHHPISISIQILNGKACNKKLEFSYFGISGPFLGTRNRMHNVEELRNKFSFIHLNI